MNYILTPKRAKDLKVSPYMYPGFRNEQTKSKIKVPFEIIEQIILNEFGLEPDDLRRDKGKQIYRDAKHIFMYLAYTMNKTTLAKVGAHIDKDHSSVIHSKKTVINVASTNKDFNKMLERITFKILDALDAEEYKNSKK